MRLKDEFIYIIKSAIASMTFFIPGLNVLSLLYGFNLYKIIVFCCSNITNKDSLKRLLFILLGLLLGYFSTKDITTYLLNNYNVQTYLFFIGIIVGGIKINNVLNIKKFSFKYLIVLIFSFILMFLMNNILISNKLSFEINMNNYIFIIIIGLLCGICILIPGLGMTYINNFVDFSSNIIFSIALIIGIIVGIYIICIFLNKLFKKYNQYINIILIGFLIANISIILININITINFANIFSSILLFLWGYLFSINIEKE